jgi:Mn-dependent DtxR family transcriptional regulator
MMIMTGDIQRETVRTDVMMSNLNRETTSEVNVEELIEQLRKQPVSVLKMIKKMIS